ncbi:MAG: hypothetical protein C0598_06000 [Marinilabiliales bacterium]|nr:MAG: hypothetical protein C0598_06000 [Marinilabiliales bacterium]
MYKLLLTTAIFISSIITALAGNDGPYIIGISAEIKSEILQENRELIIYTPASYAFTNKKYPVLFLLDGKFHFHHASGIVDFLSTQSIIPEMIVVAVVNTDRNKDFTPTKLSQRPQSGGADKFMDFFDKEVFPYLEKNYRTSNYRVLMGHSLGGTFATYALLQRPELFSSYISVSPYLMYDNNLLIRETLEKLKTDYKNKINFYMTVGNEPNYFETLDFFAQSVKTASPKGFNFSYVKRMDDNHGSSPHLSIYNGLLFIYDDWKLSDEVFAEGIKAIDKHYKSISKTYGSNIVAPEAVINLLGYKYLAEENFENAIEVFKENVKRYPESANVYDSLGEAYEKSGDIKKARENYAKAVNLSKKTHQPNYKIYLQNLQRVSE